jgi:lipoprotein-releasing system permease protein
LLYEIVIALRHLTPKRKKGILSFVTLLAIGGVSLGVGVLIIVMAVMNGFERDLREKILGVQAHLFLLPRIGKEIGEYTQAIEKMASLGEIVACAPFLHTQTILIAHDKAIGITLKGVDPELERGVTRIQSYIVAGSSDLEAEDEILLGSELASHLGVGVGSRVRAILPSVGTPVMKTFRVGGIFRCGMYEYDSLLAYSTLETLQKILGEGGMVSGVAIRLRDIYQAEEVKERLMEIFGSECWVRTWMEMNRTLFSALRLEKTVMFIILVLIVFVAGLGIANSLILMVMHKRREVGILLSLGATRWGIGRIFMIEGLCIGISGVIAGIFFGLIGCELLSRYQFVRIPQDVYYIDYLPVDVRLEDVVLVTLSALALSLLAAIYPALRASRLDPLEVMRYE